MNKFFEYPDASNEYYALIVAETEGAANQVYEEMVCDISEGQKPMPNEITEELVKQRLSVVVFEDGETAETELVSALESKTPYVLLIDSALC